MTKKTSNGTQNAVNEEQGSDIQTAQNVDTEKTVTQIQPNAPLVNPVGNDGLNFERVDTGVFEFFKFDRDDKSITGQLIGIFHDTVLNPKSPEFSGLPECLKYKRTGIETAIVFREWETKQIYLLPNHHQTVTYFEDFIKNNDIKLWVFRVTRVKQSEGKKGKQGVIIFDIQRALINL